MIRQETLREVVETLAPVVRPPCSPGEREAADWIADRLRAAGCRDVRVEEEVARGRYLPTIAGLGLVASAGAWLVVRGRRALGSGLTAAAAAALVDEAQNGPRVVRRAVWPARTTANVVAWAGDPDGTRTLVLMAHHDAHQTGRLYDQELQKAVHRRFPSVIENARSSVPQWWLGLAGPFLTLAGALGRRPRAALAGLALNLAGTALIADAARSPTVPGANDNLSGVAALVAAAEALRGHPPAGVRVLLVSCGSEEALQDGIRPWLARHAPELPVGQTAFLNLETVGSERLIMLEGEGPIWMEDYADPAFRDRVERCARREGIELSRGYRARASTDSVIPSRAGYATATLTSVAPWGALANYHLPTDVPENVDYDTVAQAARVALSVARDLAGPPVA